MYVCVHTQQSDNQIERWWIMDGVTFGFETNIYIKKHVSNKPTTWNDVFSCPFLSLSNDHISYPHPKGCWVPMIFLVEPRTWYWLPVTMLLCWKSGSFFFSPRSSDQTKRLTKLGYNACCFGPKLTPHQFCMYTHRIPMGLPYLLTHLPSRYNTVPSFIFHYFGIILNVFAIFGYRKLSDHFSSLHGKPLRIWDKPPTSILFDVMA